MNKKRKILITGASGFLGSHVTRRMVQDGHDVHALMRPSSDYKNLDGLKGKFTAHRGDLGNKEALAEIIEHIKPDGVFHFAASMIQSGAHASCEELVDVNILGTLHLLEALDSTRYDFFVYSGSFLEYGKKERPMKESDICEPIEFYGLTKLGGSLAVQQWGRLMHKPTIVLRLFTPYGPRMQEGRLVERLIKSALSKSEIAMTSPSIVRDFIFADDIADVCLEAAELAPTYKGEIFNLGSGVETNLEQLSELIFRLTGSSAKIRWGAYGNVVYDADTIVADMSKTWQHFSWRPRHTLEQGLQKTIQWIKSRSKP